MILTGLGFAAFVTAVAVLTGINVHVVILLVCAALIAFAIWGKDQDIIIDPTDLSAEEIAGLQVLIAANNAKRDVARKARQVRIAKRKARGV